MGYDRKTELVPLDKKCILTVQEAELYTGMTPEELMELSKDENLDIGLRVGNNRYLKRAKLEEYLDGRRLEELKLQ